MADISKFFDKKVETLEFSEIADMPVSVISGISEADGEALAKALGIKTVRDLAENKYFAVAEAVVTLAKAEKKA
ncbi:MAG: hypothetical protein H7145_20315 [Akkermansiaceae bacterium]|nr:hypothetical protein [Armatimonadota bacterium]